MLDALRRVRHGLSRAELSEHTGLSAQSITNIVRRLAERGLVTEEVPAVPHGRGRPAAPLVLDPAGRFAVGVHVDPTVTAVVLVDLTASVVAARRTVAASATTPDDLVTAVAGAVAELTAGVDPDRVLGVGVATPGPVDTGAGVVVGAPLLPGWDRVELRRLVREATGLPVVMHKDTAAAAVGELWHEADPADLLFLYLGTGLGAGFVVNGELLPGSTDNAGEIGHMMVSPDGPRCHCGQAGCVGASSMPRTLVGEAVAAGVLAPLPHDAGDVAVDDAFTRLCAAATGDPAAREVLERSAARLARAAVTLCNALDVGAVVVGGPAWSRTEPVFLPILRDVVAATTEARRVHEVAVRGSVLGDDAAVVGAACLVLEHSFSPRPATLLIR
ncbi:MULTISPECIES: ROK family transcriptional regulator [unclassified Pseudonocardia]|uniref:ROK family transcriptional regulator n=1 Tax=unclassified Pseudonocardia TaxID=2619320 RepID=UPI0001FFEC1C|nr:Transcriptional regulator/sugar kinase [Pseudonocardia sp. Ae707_Ps1]